MAAAPVAPAIEKLFLGREKAAEVIDVSTRTIDDAIRAGDLHAYRVGPTLDGDGSIVLDGMERRSNRGIE